MTDTIDVLKTAITAGMTTGNSDSDDFYVKSIYTGDPLALPSIECPACSVTAVPPISRLSQYVGEDTVTETFSVRFYQLAVRKNYEDAEIASAFTRLRAMIKQAELVFRTDPTFGGSYVASEIKSVNPQLPGQAGGDAYRVAEILLEVKSRALWGL